MEEHNGRWVVEKVENGYVVEMTLPRTPETMVSELMKNMQRSVVAVTDMHPEIGDVVPESVKSGRGVQTFVFLTLEEVIEFLRKSDSKMIVS